MAQKISVEDIERRQKEILDMSLKLNDMDDGEKILEEAKVIQRKAEELQAMALVFEQQQLEEAAKRPQSRPPRIIKVKLTEEQSRRVYKETGVELEVVEFVEGHDFLWDTMPGEQPPRVEAKAIKRALAMKEQSEAEEKAKKQALSNLDAMLQQNNPELTDLVNKALQDPNFLAGVLAKK